MSVENTQGQLWEVFIQSKSGLPYIHSGSIHASDVKMAMQRSDEAKDGSKKTTGGKAPRPPLLFARFGYRPTNEQWRQSLCIKWHKPLPQWRGRCKVETSPSTDAPARYTQKGLACHVPAALQPSLPAGRHLQNAGI